MKNKLIGAILIFAAGTGGFCALRTSAVTWQKKAQAVQVAHAAEAQQLAAARIEYAELTEHVRELKEQLAAAPAARGGASGLRAPLIPESQHPSAAEAERLLAELGFNWNSTGDYLVVSKDILHSLRLAGVKKSRLSDTACQILAIAPAERATIEAGIQQLSATFKEWTAAHVQRSEPEGDVLARYSLQLDNAFSGSLSNAFVSQVHTILGPERGELLVDYSSDWMTDLGMYGSEPATMTVTRERNGDEIQLNLELKRSGGTMSCGVTPWQPFPETFRSLFPGGWADLAAREGFELPKEFKK